MATNYNAVKKLNQAKAQRQAQLAQAYEDLGGSNPAYKPIQTNNVLASPQRMSATIPQLEKAVVNAYEGNDSYKPRKVNIPYTGNQLQKLTQREPSGGGGGHAFGTPTETNWDKLKAALTTTNTIGQNMRRPDNSEARQDYAPLYNDILDRQLEQKFRRAGINSVNDLPDIITQTTIMGQGNGMYGKPTPELQALGVTQEDIQRYLDPRRIAEAEARTQAFAQSHPVLATGVAAVANPFESAIGDFQQVSDRIQGKPLTQSYAPSTIMRNTVSEGINSNLGRIAYGGVNSILDLGMAMLLAKGLGGSNNQAVARTTAGIMGAEKANDTMNSAIERGLNPNQVLAEGAASGASTYLSEMALGPLENITRGQGNILMSMLSEGAQEGLEDIIDTLFDQAITLSGGNVEKSELAQNYNAYINAGYSEDDAKAQVVKDYINQVGIDVALGGITGGLMQGGSNVMSGRNAVTGNLTQRNQNQILESLNADEVSPDNYNTFSQAVDSLKEQVPEMSKKLDSLRNDVSNQIINDVKEAADTVLESLDPNAYNEFVQNAEQIKAQIPALESDIDNILADFNNEFVTLASESNIKANADEENFANTEINSENVKAEVDNINENVGIPVYRGYNRSLNPLDSNLARTKTLTDFLPKLGETAPGAIPLSYYTEDQNVAKGYARQNLDFYNEVGPEAYRILTGDESIPVEGETKAYSINPNNVFDITGLGEKIDSEQLYRYLSETLGPEFEKAFPSLDYFDPNVNTENEGSMFAYQLLRNNGDANYGDTGTRFYNLLKSLGYDAVRYAEQGTNQYAVFPEVQAIENAQPTESQTDFRSDSERQIDDITDNLFDLIEDGKMTGEDFENATRELSELTKRNPELADKAFDLLTQVSEEYRAKRYNADVYPDVENAQTYEELGDIIDAEIDSLDEISEDAAFPTSQPGVDTGRLKESQTYTNTGENSGMTQQEKEIHSEKAVRGETGGMLYQEVGEQESYEQAQKNLEEKGEREEAQRLFHKNGWNQVDTDEAMTLLKQTREEAERIEAEGGDATNEWEYAADLFIKIQTEATNHAQALQALAKWSRVREDGSLTPEGRLAAGVRAATQATKVTNSETNLNAELAPKQFQKKFKFKKEFVADFLKAAREFDKQKNNLTVRQQDVGESRLAKMIRRQIPMTLRERFTSILMDDMLFSIRTLISRNAGGNAGLALVDQTITKLIAGGIDRAASNFTGVRTTTGLTAEGAKRYLSGLVEGAKRTAQDYFKDDVNTWKPGQRNDFEALINENRRLFNDNSKSKVLNKAAKVGNFLDRIVSFGLTFGDNPFYTAAYRQSEYEFDKLREQGWFDKTKDGKPISDEQFEKIKQAHSVINALTAVYQNDTALSRGLMNIRKGLAEASTGVVGLDVLTQAAMPFVKTPANVALTAIEYSPFGLAKNAVNTFKEVAADYKRSHGKNVVGDRTFNQQRFVRETSRNLVGTMLYALAIAMAQAGHLTGAYSEDDDMKQAQREAGMQEYAFVSPFTGNQWQTSWIPVIGNAAVAGAATVDAMNAAKEGENPFLEGLKAGASSQFENSMLQGLSRLFGTQSSFSSDSILKNVVNTIKSAGTQLIPSIVRQTAAAMDPYQRDTRGIDPNDRYILPMIASLPHLRESLQPRIGRTGEELEQNAGRNVFQKWMDNLVNPAIVTTPNAAPDAVRDEAMRLHESLAGVNNTVANGAFEPYVTIKQITTDTHTPTAEEYTQYQRDAYSQMNSTAEQMIGTDYYQNLSDLEKAKALAKIYEAVRDAVRYDTVGGKLTDLDAAARIYSQEGADALIEYVMTGAYRNQIGASNSQANNEYIQDQLANGNYAALEQDMATSQELATAGFNENLTFKYNHAVQYIPSLTPTEFAETWNDIDGMIKPNGTVSQDEVLAYLNQNPTSWDQSDVNMYWQAYLQNPSYQPYFNEEEGIWKKKRG